MQRIIDIDHVDQALEIQKYLLRKYGIEASIREIQKKYYRFCGMCNCWYDIHGINEDWYAEGEPKKTRLEAFCEDIDQNLDDDD